MEHTINKMLIRNTTITKFLKKQRYYFFKEIQTKFSNICGIINRVLRNKTYMKFYKLIAITITMYASETEQSQDKMRKTRCHLK